MNNNYENIQSMGTPVHTRRLPVRYRIIKTGMPVPAPSGGLAAHGACMAPRKDYKKIAGVVILAVLLLLIFFSRTIYGYNLPVITSVKPENGRLSKLEISSGIVDYAEVENLYAAIGGKVEEVLVKEGDVVTGGQELYRISFDRDEAERKLREIQNSRNKLLTDIQNINLRLERQNRHMADLAYETYEEEKLSTEELDAIQYRLDTIHLNIRKARDELRDMRERYDDGDVRKIDVDRAVYALQALYLELNEQERKQGELKQKLEEQEERARVAVEEQEKIQASKLMDYESDIAALELDLRNKNIDLNNLAIQEEPHKKALADFDAYAVITAPIGGSIISLGAEKGGTIRADQLVATVGAAGTYELECSISLDNNFVIPGDVVELSNSSHVIKGMVAKVIPAAQGKTVTVALESDVITSGETFDVTFRKDSDTTYTLIPNGALNQDNDGYFVNLVKRRDGILGKEYYLERLDVYIGDSDFKNTAITQGIRFFEPIMLISGKPVTAGDVVSLSNAGDFFEN